MGAELAIRRSPRKRTGAPFLVDSCLVRHKNLNGRWHDFERCRCHRDDFTICVNVAWSSRRNFKSFVTKIPDFVMAKYFLGNVFNDRFNMTKVYNPNWGGRRQTGIPANFAKVAEDHA